MDSVLTHPASFHREHAALLDVSWKANGDQDITEPYVSFEMLHARVVIDEGVPGGLHEQRQRLRGHRGGMGAKREGKGQQRHGKLITDCLCCECKSRILSDSYTPRSLMKNHCWIVQG